MTANASAARVSRGRKLFQQLAAAALIVSLAALLTGIGAAGAQAKVASDPFAIASARSAHQALISARHSLDSTRRELRQARRARSRAQLVLRLCRQRGQRHCAAAHRAARHASARARRLHRSLESAAAEVSRAHVALLERRAPKVRASGATVQWTSVAHVTHYVLESTVTGESPHYSLVKGVSATPTSAAGTTVSYSVRTNVVGSEWSHPIALSYSTESGTVQAVSTSKGSGGERGHKPTKGESASTGESTTTEEAPATEEAAPSAGEEQVTVEEGSGSTATTFQPGLDSGTNLELDVQGAEALKAKLVRIEFPVGDTPAQMEPVIAAYAEAGSRVLPLAGFYGGMPTPEQARDLAAWASAFGPGGSFWSGRSDGNLAIQDIEFGNETSYGYQYGDNAGELSYQERARTYAIRVKEAAEAIDGTLHHVGVLAQEDDWTGEWANGMFEAVPNLGRYVAGWTVHPYGPNWEGRIQDLIKQTASHGAPASIPIDITEWGLATDNGKCLTDNYGWNQCMTYEEAATTLTSTLGEMRGMLGSRLGMFILYQVRDQQLSTASTNEREAYFGALQHELQPKGAFTSAVERVLAGE